MKSNPSAETRSRLEAVLAAAGHSSEGCPRSIRPGLWRWTHAGADLALKLFDGPNAEERLRTEAALYRELGRADAPVPTFFAESANARALARAWVPGATLYERLLTGNPLVETEPAAVWRAWSQLITALAPWALRVPEARLKAARQKRQMELAAVAQAVAKAFPSVTAEAIHALSQTAASGELTIVPLDASPSNIVSDGESVTFIDLELLGLDFQDWTFAKYVTAVDDRGAVHSLVPGLADPRTLDQLDAAVTVLALARAAGLWGMPQMAPSALEKLLPGRSVAAGRIRAALGLESHVPPDSG